MLSFLTEQEQASSEAAKRSDTERSDAQKDRPGGHSAVHQDQQEYSTVSARNKTARRSTYLLAFLFSIGLLCLWFMIKKSTFSPQLAAAGVISTQEAQIEMALQTLGGATSETLGRVERIVQKFYEFSDVPQVKVGELVKNPFRHEKFMGNLRLTDDMEEEAFDKVGTSDRQKMQQAQNMQLLSIMATAAGNCCMIDDRLLYEGDSIGGFNVCRIGDSFVKLQSADVEVILKLQDK